MRSLECRKITNNGCAFVARGRTSWDVVRAMFEHAAKEHKKMLIEITYEEQKKLIEKMNKEMQ